MKSKLTEYMKVESKIKVSRTKRIESFLFKPQKNYSDGRIHFSLCLSEFRL